MEDYTDEWEGKIENAKTFNFSIEITNFQSENPILIISNINKNKIIEHSFRKNKSNFIFINVGNNLSFEGRLSETKNEINGFIKSGLLLYHLKLKKTKLGVFKGFWNILMVDELKSQNFYLSLENGSGNEYEAYPILGDNRFTGTWCGNFQKKKDTISFSDIKTGLNFKGKLGDKIIQLSVYLENNLVTKITLAQSQTNWQIGEFQINKKGNKHRDIELPELEKLILIDSLPNTHSVLISKSGKIVYENYFDGYHADIPHDTRSASKSIASAIVGIAKDKSLFKNVEQSIFDFLPNQYQTLKKELKSEIDIKSLLTMSSGLDADDYTRERRSAASEGSYQSTNDWTETVLKASIINKPNTIANYGSANPYLLGVAMNSVVSQPLELFMDQYLFQELEISNYIIQTDRNGNPYFGGGMYLTPRDMLKFGELYLNKGKWKTKNILSKNWVEDSFKNYRNLENVPEKNGYGYLWWHNIYQVNGQYIESIEARGNGGQYIFVIPGLKAVIVITSANFRNGKFQQPELILERHILPKIID